MISNLTLPLSAQSENLCKKKFVQDVSDLKRNYRDKIKIYVLQFPTLNNVFLSFVLDMSIYFYNSRMADLLKTVKCI